MILKQDTIKDMMLIYDEAEANIQASVMKLIMPDDSLFDKLIDSILSDLMK